MELYEATKDEPRGPDPGPSIVEETVEVSLLKTVVEQLQQVAQHTANTAAGMGAKGQAKVKKIPRPKTARDLYARKEAWEAHLFIESVLRFVPQEEFDRLITEESGGD